MPVLNVAIRSADDLLPSADLLRGVLFVAVVVPSGPFSLCVAGVLISHVAGAVFSSGISPMPSFSEVYEINKWNSKIEI